MVMVVMVVMFMRMVVIVMMSVPSCCSTDQICVRLDPCNNFLDLFDQFRISFLIAVEYELLAHEVNVYIFKTVYLGNVPCQIGSAVCTVDILDGQIIVS